MAEAPTKSPLEKMRLKPGMSAFIYGAPDELSGGLGLPEGTVAATDRSLAPGDVGFDEVLGSADFVLTFAANQAEAVARLAELAPAIAAGAVVWIAYPKGGKAAGLDVSRDTIWAAANEVGAVLIANVAVDSKWSSVRVREAKPGEL